MERLRAWGAMLCIALAVPACIADEETDESIEGVSDELVEGRRFTPAEVQTIVRDAGFPERVVPEMVCTAKHESSFYERASHKNRNGSVDRGLFQINDIHLRRPGCPSTRAALYDANVNARCAYEIWKEQGLGAWYGYKSHRAECDAYRIR